MNNIGELEASRGIDEMGSGNYTEYGLVVNILNHPNLKERS